MAQAGQLRGRVGEAQLISLLKNVCLRMRIPRHDMHSPHDTGRRRSAAENNNHGMLRRYRYVSSLSMHTLQYQRRKEVDEDDFDFDL